MSAILNKKEEKKDKKQDEKPVKVDNAKPNNAYRLLKKPLVTEKVSIMASENKYVFEVARDANKVEIKKAIKAIYGIEPEKVNIINNLGKKVQRGRVQGKRKDTKKAMVKLPKGKTIDVYEGV